MYGQDKFGRAILLLMVKKHSRSLRDLQQCMRFLCYNLDKAIRAADPKRNPTGKITGIFDLEGESLPQELLFACLRIAVTSCKNLLCIWSRGEDIEGESTELG